MKIDRPNNSINQSIKKIINRLTDNEVKRQTATDPRKTDCPVTVRQTEEQDGSLIRSYNYKHHMKQSKKGFYTSTVQPC